MEVSLEAPVLAYGPDGTLIELKQGKGVPKLKDILLHALRDVHYDIDQKLGVKEKLDRFLLERRIAPEDYGGTAVYSVEMTEGEIKMSLERVGRIFLQAGLVGAVALLLDTNVAPPTDLCTKPE